MTTSSSGGQPASAANSAEENARQLGRRIEYDGDHLYNLLADGQYQDTVRVIVRIYNNLGDLRPIVDGILGPSTGTERWREMNLGQGTSSGRDNFFWGFIVGALVVLLIQYLT